MKSLVKSSSFKLPKFPPLKVANISKINEFVTRESTKYIKFFKNLVKINTRHVQKVKYTVTITDFVF